MHSISSSTIASAGLNVSMSASGRTTVPVSRGSYIYSHFKHVSGVPAPEGVQGASVSKLKILDTLIDRLSQMRKNSASSFVDRGDDSSEKRIDALIEQYQNQVKQLSAASVAMPYKPNPAIAAGTFVNLVS